MKKTKNILYISEEEITMLCDECKKDTTTGKLACVSLNNLLILFEKQSKALLEVSTDYLEYYKGWKVFFWCSVILCVVFLPKFPISHFMFWVNLALPVISAIVQYVCKNVCLYCAENHHKILKAVNKISEALELE